MEQRFTLALLPWLAVLTGGEVLCGPITGAVIEESVTPAQTLQGTQLAHAHLAHSAPQQGGTHWERSPEQPGGMPVTWEIMSLILEKVEMGVHGFSVLPSTENKEWEEAE